MTTRRTESQFLLSVFFSVIAVLINYAISFFLTPFITENIGTEAYGYVTLAKTISNYASILTIALNSFSSRYISVEYHKGNFKNANRFFNSILIADVVLSAFLFVLFSLFIANIQHFINIPKELLTEVKLLFLFDICNFIIITCSTVYLSSTIIKNRLELASIARSISFIAEATFLIIAYKYLRPSVSYVGVGLLISSVIILIINFIISRRMTPELVFKPSYFSFDAVKKAVMSGIWNSVNSLGNMLNTGLDLLICNLLLDPYRTGQLSIVKTITTIFLSMYQLVAQPFQPLQLKYYAENDRSKLVESFNIGIKINGLISNVAFGFFVVWGKCYYDLWTPSQDTSLIHTISKIAIMGSIIEGAVFPLYYTYTITVKNRIPCLVTVASGLLNVIGMYVLITYTDLGVFAVVGTTAVLSWGVNFVFNPMYSAKCLGVKVYAFYPALIRHIVSCIVITIVLGCIGNFIVPSTWIGLIACGILSALLGSIIHGICVLNRGDILLLKSRILKNT